MSPKREFLAFEDVTLRAGGQLVFAGTNWVWRLGERWGMLGPDGSGKAILVEALEGRVPVVKGEIRGPHSAAATASEVEREAAVAVVSPAVQREVAVQESSFYQSRWHAGMEDHQRTVSDFLCRESIEEQNPFEVREGTRGHSGLPGRRRQVVRWLGIKPLLRRKLAHLSNGELRKALLARALLRQPRLLVLDDPYAGLDQATRRELARIIPRLARSGLPVLIVTCRVEDLSPGTTHLMIVKDHRVVAQGRKTEMLKLWKLQFPGPRSKKECPDGRRPTRAAAARRIKAGTPVIELQDVTIRGERRTLLERVNWTVKQGECWALLGPNGAGKSTLLNLIQGDHPQAYAQDIRLFGRPNSSTRVLWEAREQMGWVSPELHYHYPAECPALEVVCSGFFNSMGLYHSCSARQRGLARHWLEELGLGGEPDIELGELSFGDQRLVLLARAVVKSPRLLILDEPCTGFDGGQRLRFLAAADRIIDQTGASLICVAHREEELPRCITHVARLTRGKLESAGAISSSRPS